MKTVAYHNLGCKVNSYEMDAMLQALQAQGYQLVPFDRTGIRQISISSIPVPLPILRTERAGRCCTARKRRTRRELSWQSAVMSSQTRRRWRRTVP